MLALTIGTMQAHAGDGLLGSGKLWKRDQNSGFGQVGATGRALHRL